MHCHARKGPRAPRAPAWAGHSRVRLALRPALRARPPARPRVAEQAAADTLPPARVRRRRYYHKGVCMERYLAVTGEAVPAQPTAPEGPSKPQLTHVAVMSALLPALGNQLRSGLPVMIKPVVTELYTKMFSRAPDNAKYKSFVAVAKFAKEVLAGLGRGHTMRTVGKAWLVVNDVAATALLLASAQVTGAGATLELESALAASLVKGEGEGKDEDGDGSRSEVDTDSADAEVDAADAGEGLELLPRVIDDEVQRKMLRRMVALDVHHDLENKYRAGLLHTPYPYHPDDISMERSRRLIDPEMELFFRTLASGDRFSAGRDRAAWTACEVILFTIRSKRHAYRTQSPPPIPLSNTIGARYSGTGTAFARQLSKQGSADDPAEGREHENTIAAAAYESYERLGTASEGVQAGTVSAICDNIDTDQHTSSRHAMRNCAFGTASSDTPGRQTYPRQVRVPQAPSLAPATAVQDRDLDAPFWADVPLDPELTSPANVALAAGAVQSLTIDVQLHAAFAASKLLHHDSEAAGKMVLTSDTVAAARNWKASGRVITRDPDAFISLLATLPSSGDDLGNLQLLNANHKMMVACGQTSMAYFADVGHVGHLVKVAWSNMLFTDTFIIHPVPLHALFKMQELIAKMTDKSEVWELIARTKLIDKGKLLKIRKGKANHWARPVFTAMHVVLRIKMDEFAMNKHPPLKEHLSLVRELLVAAGKEVTVATADAACSAVQSGAGAVLREHQAGINAWLEANRKDNIALDVWLDVAKAIEVAKLLRLNCRADTVDPTDASDPGSLAVWLAVVPDMIALCFRNNAPDYARYLSAILVQCKQMYKTHPDASKRPKATRGVRLPGGATVEHDDLMEADVGKGKQTTNSGSSGHHRNGDDDLWMRSQCQTDSRLGFETAAQERFEVPRRKKQNTYTGKLHRSMPAALLEQWNSDVLVDIFELGELGKLVTLIKATAVHPDVAAAMRGGIEKGRAEHVRFESRITKDGPESHLTIFSRIKRAPHTAFSSAAGARRAKGAAAAAMAQRTINALWLVMKANSMLKTPVPIEVVLQYPIEYCASCLTTAAGSQNPTSNHDALFTCVYNNKAHALCTDFVATVRSAALDDHVPVAVFVDAGPDTFDIKYCLTGNRTVADFYNFVLAGALQMAGALEVGDGNQIVDTLYFVAEPFTTPNWDVRFEAEHAGRNVTAADVAEFSVLASTAVLDPTSVAAIVASRNNKRVLLSSLHDHVHSRGCTVVNDWLAGKVGREIVLVTPAGGGLVGVGGGVIATRYAHAEGQTDLAAAPAPTLTVVAAEDGFPTSDMLMLRCEQVHAATLRASVGAGAAAGSTVGVMVKACVLGDSAVTSTAEAKDLPDFHYGMIVCPKRQTRGTSKPVVRAIDLGMLRNKMAAGVPDALRAAHVASGSRYSPSLTAGTKKKGTPETVSKHRMLASLGKLPAGALGALAKLGGVVHVRTGSGAEEFKADCKAFQRLIVQVYYDRMDDTTHLSARYAGLDVVTPSMMRPLLWADGKKHLHAITYADVHGEAHCMQVCMLLAWYRRAANPALAAPARVGSLPTDSGFTVDAHGDLARAHMLADESDANLVPPTLAAAFVCNCADKRQGRKLCAAPKTRKQGVALRCPCLDAGRACTELCRCDKSRCTNFRGSGAAATDGPAPTAAPAPGQGVAGVGAGSDSEDEDDLPLPPTNLLDAVAHDTSAFSTIDNEQGGAYSSSGSESGSGSDSGSDTDSNGGSDAGEALCTRRYNATSNTTSRAKRAEMRGAARGPSG